MPLTSGWHCIWAKTRNDHHACHPRLYRATTNRTLATQFAYNGDGARTSKTVAGDTTQYILDLAATLPVVIRDTEAVRLCGLDIIAQQQSQRLYYVHDGLGGVRQLLDTAGQIETNYAYDHPPSRWPGDWWGTTVTQWFTWYQRHPLGLVNY